MCMNIRVSERPWNLKKKTWKTLTQHWLIFLTHTYNFPLSTGRIAYHRHISSKEHTLGDVGLIQCSHFKREVEETESKGDRASEWPSQAQDPASSSCFPSVPQQTFTSTSLELDPQLDARGSSELGKSLLFCLRNLWFHGTDRSNNKSIQFHEAAGRLKRYELHLQGLEGFLEEVVLELSLEK